MWGNHGNDRCNRWCGNAVIWEKKDQERMQDDDDDDNDPSHTILLTAWRPRIRRGCTGKGNGRSEEFTDAKEILGRIETCSL